MKERPILFSGPMVRAILDGSKSQTRRVMKPQPEWVNENAGCGIATGGGIMPSPRNDWLHWRGSRLFRPEPRCPYGLPGDRLWVRETWRVSSAHDSLPPKSIPVGDGIEYAADKTPDYLLGKSRPSIHMPRWASRILLEITDVHVERVQDISDRDARDEGAEQIGDCEGAYVAGFRRLWESINGPDSWSANPWVWVVEFRRIEP